MCRAVLRQHTHLGFYQRSGGTGPLVLAASQRSGGTGPLVLSANQRSGGTGPLVLANQRSGGTGPLVLANTEWVDNDLNPIALARTSSANTTTADHLYMGPLRVGKLRGEVYKRSGAVKREISGSCAQTVHTPTLLWSGQSLSKLSPPRLGIGKVRVNVTKVLSLLAGPRCGNRRKWQCLQSFQSRARNGGTHGAGLTPRQRNP